MTSLLQHLILSNKIKVWSYELSISTFARETSIVDCMYRPLNMYMKQQHEVVSETEDRISASFAATRRVG